VVFGLVKMVRRLDAITAYSVNECPFSWRDVKCFDARKSVGFGCGCGVALLWVASSRGHVEEYSEGG
jgi:hypothetical protein